MTPQQALDLAHDRPSSCDDDLYDWAVDAENALRLMAERLMVAEELAAQYGAKNDALLVTFARVCARLGIDTEAAKAAPGKPSDVLVAAIDALTATPAQAQQAADSEGPIAEGWVLTIGEGHAGYGVYAHMPDYQEEGAVFLLAATKAEELGAPIAPEHDASLAWHAAWAEKTHAEYLRGRADGEALATKAEAKPLTDAQCDAIYTALNEWAREFDEHDFGLPASCGGGVEGGREIIRKALGIGASTGGSNG